MIAETARGEKRRQNRKWGSHLLQDGKASWHCPVPGCAYSIELNYDANEKDKYSRTRVYMSSAKNQHKAAHLKRNEGDGKYFISPYASKGAKMVRSLPAEQSAWKCPICRW